jgi:hypothetical protein
MDAWAVSRCERETGYKEEENVMSYNSSPVSPDSRCHCQGVSKKRFNLYISEQRVEIWPQKFTKE